MRQHQESRLTLSPSRNPDRCRSTLVTTLDHEHDHYRSPPGLSHCHNTAYGILSALNHTQKVNSQLTARGSGAGLTERRGGVPIAYFLVKNFLSWTKTRFDEHGLGPQTNKYNATTIQQMVVVLAPETGQLCLLAVCHSAQSHQVRISGVTTMLDMTRRSDCDAAALILELLPIRQ
jgi:hypothetical protein